MYHISPMGMMFQPKASDGAPNMHANLDMLLSLCSPYAHRAFFPVSLLVLGKFGPRPIGTRSGPDQTPWFRSRSGIFPKTPDRLVPGLGIPILPETVSDPVWTGTA